MTKELIISMMESIFVDSDYTAEQYKPIIKRIENCSPLKHKIDLEILSCVVTPIQERFNSVLHTLRDELKAPATKIINASNMVDFVEALYKYINAEQSFKKHSDDYDLFTKLVNENPDFIKEYIDKNKNYHNINIEDDFLDTVVNSISGGLYKAVTNTNNYNKTTTKKQITRDAVIKYFNQMLLTYKTGMSGVDFSHFKDKVLDMIGISEVAYTTITNFNKILKDNNIPFMIVYKNGQYAIVSVSKENR